MVSHHSGPADPGSGKSYPAPSGRASDPAGQTTVGCPIDGALAHPDSKGLQLGAWKLSGVSLDRKDFGRQSENNLGTYVFCLRRFGVCRTRQTLPTMAFLTLIADSLPTLFQEGRQGVDDQRLSFGCCRLPSGASPTAPRQAATARLD